MARAALILAAAALLIVSCPEHGSASPTRIKGVKGKAKQQVDIAAVASLGKGQAPVVHLQVVTQCDDVCQDDCTQKVETKCEKVPYTDQECTTRAYSDNSTTCTKKCTTVAAVPVPTNEIPVTTTVDSSGQVLPEYGDRVLSEPTVGRKLRGGGMAYAQQVPTYVTQPQAVTYVVAQPQQQLTYVAAQPQYTYVATQQQANVVCQDECVTIPVLRNVNECQLVQKERDECTDYTTRTCTKTCKPECREITRQVAAPLSTGKGG